MSEVKTSDVVNVAVSGAGLGLGASGTAAAIVAAAPVTATTSTVFAGVTFTSGGASLAPALAVAMASNPVGWAIAGAVAVAALWAVAKAVED